MEKCNPESREKLLYEDVLLDITVKEANAIYCQMLGMYLTGFQDEVAAACFDKSIQLKKEQLELIVAVPVEIRGVAAMYFFTEHLCGDQIKFLEKLKHM